MKASFFHQLLSFLIVFKNIGIFHGRYIYAYIDSFLCFVGSRICLQSFFGMYLEGTYSGSVKLDSDILRTLLR